MHLLQSGKPGSTLGVGLCFAVRTHLLVWRTKATFKVSKFQNKREEICNKIRLRIHRVRVPSKRRTYFQCFCREIHPDLNS